MTVYVPGTKETDPAKQNRSLAALAAAQTVDEANITTNTTNITALQTPNYGLVNGSGALGVSLSKITASLGADVLLNNVANFFDGPSVAQGTTGTWFASGTVTLTSTSADNFLCKLWDGTTVIASALTNNVAAARITVSLSGFLASPAGNLRISCQDNSSTAGKILFNISGLSKDSTITAVRIA